jgi:hypothetical protein
MRTAIKIVELFHNHSIYIHFITSIDYLCHLKEDKIMRCLVNLTGSECTSNVFQTQPGTFVTTGWQLFDHLRFRYS